MSFFFKPPRDMQGNLLIQDSSYLRSYDCPTKRASADQSDLNILTPQYICSSNMGFAPLYIVAVIEYHYKEMFEGYFKCLNLSLAFKGHHHPVPLQSSKIIIYYFFREKLHLTPVILFHFQRRCMCVCLNMQAGPWLHVKVYLS